VSCLRLKTLVVFASTLNPTWDQYDVAKWSTIEINVGIICACMPSLRVVLGRILPRLFYSTRKYGAQSNMASSVVSAGARRTGVGSSAAAMSNGASRKSGFFGKSNEGITITQSFEVDDHDERNLVPLRDMTRWESQNTEKDQSVSR
jgi:hypothetical protein